MYTRDYADVFAGDERWTSLPTPDGDTFAWDADSTYVRKPPYFDGMEREPAPVTDIAGARVLAKLGDSVTTDHISPGRRDQDRLPRRALPGRARRRAARLQLLRLAPRQPRGDDPRHVRQHPAAQPAGAGHRGRRRPATCRPASRRRSTTPRWRTRRPGVPLVVLAGKEYGSGSSRDWAAKGTALLGVRAVLAESYERIHRSNLIGMGVLPLQYAEGETAESLGLTGEETFDDRRRRGDERRRRRAARRSPCRRTASEFQRSCGSTPPARPATTGTAGSCRTCCARCSERVDRGYRG